MSSKHRLRRSCAFCRARKIKCSNEAICEACRRQGADCIYDFEPARPKARSSQDGIDTTGLPTTPSMNRQSVSGSSMESPVAMEDGTALLPDDMDNVALALEQTFYENFSPRRTSSHPRLAGIQQPQQRQSSTPSLTNSASTSSASFSATSPPVPPLEHSNSDPSPLSLGGHSVKYSSVLQLLTHDLVGLAVDQFGSLGCHHVENGGARFFLSGLANDETQTMFDDTSLGSNPVSEYGQRQQTQLIDVWYTSHPLSFIVSKTLLLRELRDGTHDEILLAVILAEANFSIGDEVAVARGRVLLRWAAAQLRTRPLGGSQLSQNGTIPAEAAATRMFSGISTRIFNGSSTAQALVLLGWNALCSSQMRRATCYIGLAGRIATDLKAQITSTADPKASSRINGIDVFDVEKELIDHMYWTSYSLSLWAFVQTGNRQFAPPLPASQSAVFVPVTEASSAVIQLDVVSENFNTLQKQKAVIRETWPLAHVASVVAYICTFYPADPEVPVWTGAGFQQRMSQQIDVASICREISRVLAESTHHLCKQGAELTSRSIVLGAYNTLAVHFLFPALPAGRGDEVLMPEVIERFFSLAQDILQIFAAISDQPQEPFATIPSLRASLAGILSLAVDTCSRAFSFIHAREGQLIPAQASTLEALAGRMYATSKDDFLSQNSTLRMARKQLRASVRIAQRGSSSVANNNGGALGLQSSPMRRSTSSRSPVDSDHLSTASTAAFDSGSSNFISPKDMSMMPSPPVPSIELPLNNIAAPTFNQDMFKPDWQSVNPDDAFRSATLNPRALGIGPTSVSAAADPLCVNDLVDLQSAWYPQMDYEMANSMNTMPFDWADMNPDIAVNAGGWPDMDAVL